MEWEFAFSHFLTLKLPGKSSHYPPQESETITSLLQLISSNQDGCGIDDVTTETCCMKRTFEKMLQCSLTQVHNIGSHVSVFE